MTADAVVIATSGQNALFGKTTGSTQCDGYAAVKLFMQGAELKNLEFIQYQPTTLKTPQKRMLISEAARGEGGRAWLDISFLDKSVIDQRLPEVRDLCAKYAGLDVTRKHIPVQSSVHFFMGGLAVHLNHETNIRNLFAVGECASMYHGANRLGSIAELSGAFLGNVAKWAMRVFFIVLLTLTGTVFVNSPAALIARLTPAVLNDKIWIAVMLIYYVLATLLPIDKLIGKLYPVFGVILIVMAVSVHDE